MAVSVSRPAPLLPLSADERAVVARVVDSAPPLRPAVVAELSALIRPVAPFLERDRVTVGGVR